MSSEPCQAQSLALPHSLPMTLSEYLTIPPRVLHCNSFTQELVSKGVLLIRNYTPHNYDWESVLAS